MDIKNQCCSLSPIHTLMQSIMEKAAVKLKMLLTPKHWFLLLYV